MPHAESTASPAANDQELSFTFECLGETFYAWTDMSRGSGGEIMVSCRAGDLPNSLEARTARKAALAAVNKTAHRRDMRIVFSYAGKASVGTAIVLDGDHDAGTLLSSAATAAINALQLVATVRSYLNEFRAVA